MDNNADCALADPGAFAPPGEVALLQVGRNASGDAVLAWSDLGPSSGAGTVYDIATGDLGTLAISGTAGGVTLDCGAPSTTLTDATLLPPGNGAWYIVRGRNVCADGSWGVGGIGGDRFGPVCP